MIGPDKKVKLILVYPMTTGRNFDEVLRVIDSLQLTAKHKVATPVNWQQGEDVIIAGSVSDDEATRDLPRRLEGAAALHPHRAGARHDRRRQLLVAHARRGPGRPRPGPRSFSGRASQAASVRRRTRLRPPAHMAMMSALAAAPAKTAFQSVPFPPLS